LIFPDALLVSNRVEKKAGTGELRRSLFLLSWGQIVCVRVVPFEFSAGKLQPLVIEVAGRHPSPGHRTQKRGLLQTSMREMQEFSFLALSIGSFSPLLDRDV
jgi:hypothetical protein